MPRDATTGWASNIKKNGKKVWVARWIKADGMTGEKVCKSQTEAKKYAAQMTMAVADLKARGLPEQAPDTPQQVLRGGTYIDAGVAFRRGLQPDSFEEIAEKYCAAKMAGYNGAPPVKKNTIHGYKKNQRFWIQYFQEMSEKHRMGWIEAATHARDDVLAIASDKNGAFGRKTAKAKFEELRRVCEFAVAEGFAEMNPVAGQEIKLAVAEEKVRAKAIRKEQAYRPDEIQALLKAADEMCEDMEIDARSRQSFRKVYRPLLHVLVKSGIRISEARALTRPNIDFANNSISVETAADYENETDTPKSANAVRDIPVPADTMAHLKQTMQWHRHPYVFASKKGTVRAYNALRDHFLLKLCERAEVPNRGFHGFRHHFASMHIKAGTQVHHLSAMLGHHAASFTMDTYVHFFEDNDRPTLDVTAI